MRPSAGGDVAIERIEASAYRIPTDAPESDGTLEWDATTLVLVEATAGDVTGIGYSYTHHAAATLVDELLGPAVVGMDAIAVPAAWAAMVRAVRNVGRPGLVATAISAVDTALWDLKARLLGLPLCDLLGSVRDGVPVYGIGAFTRVPGHGLDAALLVIPLVGLLPPTDPRVVSTVETIRDRLARNELVYRYLGPDGLPGGEGAFVICSFWLVEALAHLGRLDEAHEHFARLLDRRNDLGLLAEEIDPESGEPRGNFPQALSHIGLINAALTLEEKEGSVGQPRSNVPRIAPKTTWAASVTSGVCLP